MVAVSTRIAFLSNDKSPHCSCNLHPCVTFHGTMVCCQHDPTFLQLWWLNSAFQCTNLCAPCLSLLPSLFLQDSWVTQQFDKCTTSVTAVLCKKHHVASSCNFSDQAFQFEIRFWGQSSGLHSPTLHYAGRRFLSNIGFFCVLDHSDSLRENLVCRNDWVQLRLL